jgi:hypothetical protein
VVDETPSSSKVTEENITEQPIKPKTGAANILNEALQDLETVYNLLKGAEQGKLCRPHIIKAAMTSVTCLLNDNLQ